MPFSRPLSSRARHALEILPQALEAVWPLTAKHRRDLPDDIIRLSRLLTTERHRLASGFSYWSVPGLTSAYLYYYLPWNLIRLAGILPAMPLDAPQGGQAGVEHIWCDVGSGPLTMPMALWLARPQWHDLPVRICAVDASERPLKLGLRLFKAWAGLVSSTTWPVSIVKCRLGNLERRLPSIEQFHFDFLQSQSPKARSHRRLTRQQVAPAPRGGNAENGILTRRLWLFSAANALNEACNSQRHDHACGREHGNVDTMRSLLSAFAGRPGGCPMLFVEPGTRLGGGIIMKIRQMALKMGLTVRYPCTHGNPCPIWRGDAGKTWCHFGYGSDDAPGWLEELSEKCGFGKRRLYISPLLLGLPGEKAICGSSLRARSISAPICLPELGCHARYACTQNGLVLVEGGEACKSGELLDLPVTTGSHKDWKHGIPILRGDFPDETC